MAPARIMNPILPLSTAKGDGSSAQPLNRLQQVSNMLQEVRARVTSEAAGLLPDSSSHTAAALSRPPVHWGFGSRAVENSAVRPSPSRLEEEGSCPHGIHASTSLDSSVHTSAQQTDRMTDSLTQSQSDRSQHHCNSSAAVHTTEAGLRVHRSSSPLSISADGGQHMPSRPCQGDSEEQLPCMTVSSDILSPNEASKRFKVTDGNSNSSPSGQSPIAIAPVPQESGWSLAVEPGGSWTDETIIPAAPSPDPPKAFVPATMPLCPDGESLPFSLDTSLSSNRNDGGQQSHSGVIDPLTERSGGSAAEQATRTGASDQAQPDGSEKEVEDDIEAGRNSETAAAVHETVQKVDGNETLLPSCPRRETRAMSSPVGSPVFPDPGPSRTSALPKFLYRRRRPTVQQQIEITLPPPPQRRRKSTLICDGRVPSSVLRARLWFLSTLSHAPSSAGAHVESDGGGDRNAVISTSRHSTTKAMGDGPSRYRPTQSTLAVDAEGLGKDRQSRLVFSETRRLSERSVITLQSVGTISSKRHAGESRSPRYVEIESDSSDTDSEAMWQPRMTERQLAQTTYRKPLRSRAHALRRNAVALGKSKGKKPLGGRRSQLRPPRLVSEDEAEDNESQSAHSSSGQVEVDMSLVPSGMPISLREDAQRKANGISGNGRSPSPSEKSQSSGSISICDKDNRTTTISDGRALMKEPSGIIQSVTDSEEPTKVRSLPRLLPLQAGMSTLEALKRLKRLPVASASTPSAVYSPETIEKSVPSENPHGTLLSALDLEDLRQLREEQEDIKEEQAWLQEQHRCDKGLPIESVTANVNDESNTESSTRNQIEDETDSWSEPRLQLADGGAGSEQRLYDEKEHHQRKEMRPLGKFVGDLLHWARNSDAASANPAVPRCNSSLQTTIATEETDRQRNILSSTREVTRESTAPTTASKRRVASDDGPSHDGHEVIVGSNVVAPNKKVKLDREEGRKRLARLLKAIGD